MEELTVPVESSPSAPAATASLGTAWSVAIGLCAGWVALGSSGFLVAPLQAWLVWTLVMLVVLLVRPRYEVRQLGVVAGILVLFLLLPPAIGDASLLLPLAVTAMLGALALGKSGIDRELLFCAAIAILATLLFRLAQLQIPAIWTLSDRLSNLLGRLVAAVTGQPLNIGPSFAGLDFLVTKSVFLAASWPLMGRPRLGTSLFAALGILVMQCAYLTTLCFSPHLLDRLPPVAVPLYDGPYIPPEFCWSTVAHQLLPWNLPALCGLLQATMVVTLTRWTRWQPSSPGRLRTRRELVIFAAPVALAAIAVLAAIHGGSSRLAGKTIVANLQDDIDYAVAEHDQYGQQSAGMFGLLPPLVQSLGGQLRTSRTLTDDQLQDADVLLLLHPDANLVRRKQAFWDYVRSGGSALIITDGFHPEFSFNDAVTELLQPTAISVAADAAASETRNWRAAYLTCVQGATATARAPSNRFLSDFGASLQLGWTARPMIIGQWGWSAPQQGATWDESSPLRTGSRLGDLVLAAEQRIGNGRVVVLGGNWAFTNEGMVGGFEFVGNLLSNLAHPGAGPQAWWRQVAALLCCVGIPLLLAGRRHPAQLLVVSVVLAVGVGAVFSWSAYAARVVPDGTLLPADPKQPIQHVAYIDQSHLEPYNFENWGFDAVNGLALNLMRNGYLPLMLPSVTDERLASAELFVSIAPSREFTARERAALRSFVSDGGVAVFMVGAEQADPSNSLLADFALHVPHSPVPTDDDSPEPEPFGRTHPPYLTVHTDEEESYDVAMRMFAAWPVESTDGEATVIALGNNQLRVVDSDTELPVVLARPFGDGAVILIGDTGFAMNKNLEYIGGEPFEGRYENAHFWHWLLSSLTEQQEWIPPRPAEPATESAKEDGP